MRKEQKLHVYINELSGTFIIFKIRFLFAYT